MFPKIETPEDVQREERKERWGLRIMWVGIMVVFVLSGAAIFLRIGIFLKLNPILTTPVIIIGGIIGSATWVLSTIIIKKFVIE